MAEQPEDLETMLGLETPTGKEKLYSFGFGKDFNRVRLHEAIFLFVLG